MPRILILAMHGAPPRDFPAGELAEFMRLHLQTDHGAKDGPASARYRELDRRLRDWPRSPENDPFHAASLDLGKALEQVTGAPVLVAFNEFCAPDIEGALRTAGERSPEEVVVVTPMLTPGGDHAEHDIPVAIERARKAHPQIHFRYAWPIPLEETAAFLAAMVSRLSDAA